MKTFKPIHGAFDQLFSVFLFYLEINGYVLTPGNTVVQLNSQMNIFKLSSANYNPIFQV